MSNELDEHKIHDAYLLGKAVGWEDCSDLMKRRSGLAFSEGNDEHAKWYREQHKAMLEVAYSLRKDREEYAKEHHLK